VITEIQQNSNVTYRVFDWNRVDENGKPRTLHIDQALDVINYDQVALSLTEPEIIDSNMDFVRQRLCQNPTFTTERFLMQPGGIYTGLCDGSSLEIWGLLQGEASVAGQPLSAVQYVLLPARMGPFEVHASDCAVLLRVFAG
jgi:mannose-6-phosphate isomerase